MNSNVLVAIVVTIYVIAKVRMVARHVEEHVKAKEEGRLPKLTEQIRSHPVIIALLVVAIITAVVTILTQL